MSCRLGDGKNKQTNEQTKKVKSMKKKKTEAGNEDRKVEWERE